MNPHLVLEVPDTPERIVRSTNSSSRPSVEREVIEIRTDSSSSHHRRSIGTAPHDTEQLFRQARLARLLSEAFEPKTSSQSNSEALDGSSNARAETINLSPNSPSPVPHHIGHARGRIGKYPLGEGGEGSQNGKHTSVEFLGVGSTLPSRHVGRPRSRPGINIAKEEKLVTDNKDLAGVNDKGKGVVQFGDSQPMSKQAPPSPLQSDVPQRLVSRRRLVRNGCISPCNTAKANSKSAADGVNREIHSSLAQAREQDKGKGIDPNMESQSNSHSVERCGNARKGKEIVDDHAVVNGQGEERFLPDRANPRRDGDLNVIVDPSSTSGSSDGQGWISTRHHTDKLLHESNPIIIQGEGRSQDSLSENRRQRSIRRKRKYSSTSYPPGESSSSSSFLDSEISYLGSSHHPKNFRSIRTGNTRRTRTVLGPVIEVDETSPIVEVGEVHNRSGGLTNSSGEKARQIESDELLARQLQEQLYNELPGVMHREQINANIALSVQQEENARRAASSSSVRRDRNNARGARTAHPHVRTASRTPSRSRGIFRSLPVPFAELVRSIEWSTTDVDLNLDNFFQAMEEVELGNDTDDEIPNFQQMQRDFNETKKRHHCTSGLEMIMRCYCHWITTITAILELHRIRSTICRNQLSRIIILKSHVPSASRNPQSATPSGIYHACTNFTKIASTNG
ncbi:uncharacterized protein LOC109713595 isoform X2 [Ananas comosus]|uniref:Uncharacterized protein LOC109713595 isoform X2 n=1 Tax=Ananas comosus TaxID=4615 RepID=A0A6P5FAR5_ANACO|nr:uncharacterized protein LOC109713595 isoform X2 [Ananas comosus]